jgi:hypothetical protein
LELVLLCLPWVVEDLERYIVQCIDIRIQSASNLTIWFTVGATRGQCIQMCCVNLSMNIPHEIYYGRSFCAVDLRFAEEG